MRRNALCFLCIIHGKLKSIPKRKKKEKHLKSDRERE